MGNTPLFPDDTPTAARSGGDGGLTRRLVRTESVMPRESALGRRPAGPYDSRGLEAAEEAHGCSRTDEVLSRLIRRGWSPARQPDAR